MQSRSATTTSARFGAEGHIAGTSTPCISAWVTITSLPAGIPGFQQAPFLRCGRPVEETTEYVTIGGTRSASYLLFGNVKPDLMLETSSGPKEGEELYLFGVSHRGCEPQAKRKLETHEIEFQLPTLDLTWEDSWEGPS
jgi:hypothetical protein